MKTPEQIAMEIVKPSRRDFEGYAQISESDALSWVASAIEADRAQRQGRLEDLHAYDHYDVEDDEPCDENDRILIVQIDTAEPTGRMRVYVNDGRIYDGDPETGDEWSLT